MITEIKQCFIKEKVNTGRQPELDLAKGFAILFMIWVHVFEELSPLAEGGVYTLTEILGGPFAAPVFMVCMGISICFSRKNSSKDLFRKGLSLLGIGLVLNFFRFIIPDLIKYAVTGNEAWIGDTFSLFSVDILQFAGLAFLFIALEKKLGFSNHVILAIGLGASLLGMILCGTSSGNYMVDQFLGFIWGTDTKSYFPFLNWLAFPSFGLWFGSFLQHCNDKKTFYKKFFPIGLVIMLGYLALTINCGLMFLSDGSYYRLSTLDALFFMVLSVLVFSICDKMLELFSGHSFHGLMRLSKNINTIYCIHWVVIGFLKIVTQLYFQGNIIPFWLGTLIALLLIVLSDRMAVFYLEKMKPLALEKGCYTWIKKGTIGTLIVTMFFSLGGYCMPDEKVSEPFNYSGYSKAYYSEYRKTSEYVEMSDGTKLAVDIYLPDTGSTQKAFPVIFQYTPYGRSMILPESSFADKVKMLIGVGTIGPVLDRSNSQDTLYGSSNEMVKTFLSHGYAYVCADMRGTGASYGTKVDFLPTFADDGKELIDWMAGQNWCDGNVGMFGGSYLGYSQLVTASRQPEALKCIIPEVTAFDGYSGEIRPGGVFLWKYSQQALQVLLEKNYFLPNEYCYPTTPVVDEDGDGELADEIPLDINGDGGFLDDYNYPENIDDKPQYADGNEREHIYYLATKDHMDNIPYSQLGPETPYIDSNHHYNQLSGVAYDVSPVANIEGIMESGIAIYNHGGWMDAFTRGTTELYATLKETNPSRMVIDAGYHMGTSPYWEYFGENEEEQIKGFTTEFLRFYDFYLKGIDNGLDKEDPVLIYNMNGDGWRTEKEWPLSRQEGTVYYFGENGALTTDEEFNGSDTYKVDFSHRAQWGSYPTNRWLMETPDELPVRTELDKKCLTYTTTPLSSDTEVTGYPIVEFYSSSTANTGDFFVYLEDIDENGKAVLVTEGVLNASFAELYDNDMKVMGGDKNIEVLPELPWHGYEENHANSMVFVDGNIVKLTIDLMPTSWLFREGHSIRISIAGADSGTFELTPSLSSTNDANDPNNIAPDVTIYHNAEYPSKIILPIIPR